MTQLRSERDNISPATLPLRSKLAVGATGLAVVLGCGGYVAWSLSPDRSIVDKPQDPGIALDACEIRVPELQPPSTLDELDEIPLTLDDTPDLRALPVINAHLEVPSESDQDEPRSLMPLTTFRQLGYQAGETPPVPMSAAWLTGTIEPPSATDGTDRTISRFLR